MCVKGNKCLNNLGVVLNFSLLLGKLLVVQMRFGGFDSSLNNFPQVKNKSLSSCTRAGYLSVT